MSATPLTVVATITVQSAHRAAVLAALRDAVTATNQEDGCEYYALHQDIEHPDRFMMLERWRDDAALAAHAAGPALQTLLKAMDGKADLEVVKLHAI
jgi:quinol monooxygenase YgiN